MHYNNIEGNVRNLPSISGKVPKKGRTYHSQVRTSAIRNRTRTFQIQITS